MIAGIAHITVQSLGRTEGMAARALADVAPVTATGRQLARRGEHAASVVALAPAAMSALIEAQEHMASDVTPADRSATAQKIDHILVRLTESAPATPAAQPSPGGFSVQMLMAARQQLRDTYA